MWERYDSTYLALDSHPATPPNTGKRIFTGHTSPSDEDDLERRMVRLKVTISDTFTDTPSPGMPILLRAWDVDDPSADDEGLPQAQCKYPLDCDDEDHDDYSDPFDNSANFTFWYFMGRTAAHVPANENEVYVTVVTSLYPGDNARVTATTSPRMSNDLNWGEVDGDSGYPSQVKNSEMLTVWRKLHVELDSMVTVTAGEDNWFRGGIDTGSLVYDSGDDETTVSLHKDLDDYWEETKEYHFENGDFSVAVGSFTPLRTISHIGHDKIVVDGNCSIGWPMSYSLKDDDDTCLLPEDPDTSKMDSIFEDCYIECHDDARGSTQTLSFKRHVGGSTTTASAITDAGNRGSQSDESRGWWVVYIYMAYQPGYSQDNDPDSETSVLGATHPTDFQATAIFLETIRDYASESSGNATTIEQQLVVHEIGHQVLEHGTHTANTIMNISLPVSSSNEKFSNADIATIRGKSSSPGK